MALVYGLLISRISLDSSQVHEPFEYGHQKVEIVSLHLSIFDLLQEFSFSLPLILKFRFEYNAVCLATFFHGQVSTSDNNGSGNGHGKIIMPNPSPLATSILFNYGSQGKSQAQQMEAKGILLSQPGYPVTVLRKAVGWFSSCFHALSHLYSKLPWSLKFILFINYETFVIDIIWVKPN